MLVPGLSAAAGQNKCAAIPLASIHFDPKLEAIIIPVRIGKRDYQFLLDTGASTSVFDVKLRPQMGTRIDSTTVTTPDGGELEWNLYNPPDARVSSIPLTKGPVACQDFRSLREATGFSIYGCAGLDFFKDRIVSIDFDAGRIDVLPPDTEKDPTWGEKLPIAIGENEVMRIMATIGETVWEPFVVDTGNLSTGDLSETTFSHVIDSPYAHYMGTSNCLTFSGSSCRRDAVVSQFSLGSYRHENLHFTSARDNILGLKFFARYRVTFDLPHQRLYLAKGKHFSDPDSGSSSGLWLFFNAGKVEVVSVDEKSPAYATGIRQNDMIVKLAGQAVADLKPSEVRRLLSQEGKEVEVTIEHNGKRFALSFDPKEYN
jgi:hypothetical protein